MNTTELPIIKTENVERIKTAVSSALRTNDFLAVVANIGYGKTTLYNYLTGYWNLQPEKYNMLKIKAFKPKDGQSKIGPYMKQLIETIDPDIHIPMGSEMRYEVLTNALLEAHNRKKKVIMVIDEAQDLSIQTYRDLKKIHEIAAPSKDHLFTIILFGKPTDKFMKILRSAEIGARVKVQGMSGLINSEIFEIAKVSFGVTFDKTSTQDNFLRILTTKSPLAVKYACDLIKAQHEFNGVATAEILTIAQTYGVVRLIKELGGSQNELKSRAERKYKRIFGKGTISKFVNGKLDESSVLHKDLSDVANEYLNEMTGANQEVI
jgi:type II secretory pathway predicted ATPase ExeA